MSLTLNHALVYIPIAPERSYVTGCINSGMRCDEQLPNSYLVRHHSLRRRGNEWMRYARYKQSCGKGRAEKNISVAYNNMVERL